VFQSQTAGYNVSVERSMYMGPNFEVSTGERAMWSLSAGWTFAEGSRGGELFDNFFLVFNPLPYPVGLLFKFHRSDGVVVERWYVLEARSRMTVNAGAIPELANQDFSTVITTSGSGVVAERAMYWRPVGTPPGTPWVGGHVTAGAAANSTAWFFGEGAAATGFETFYLLLNPADGPITVYANYFTELYGLVQRSYVVPARSRATVYLNAELGLIGGTAAGFTSAYPFVAERSIYWGAGRVEGTNTVGSAQLSTEWRLPEGASGNFETFLLLANPFDTATVVDISLQIEGYGQVTLPPSMRKVVPRWGRVTLYMPNVLREAEIAEGLPAGRFANVAFSTTVRVYQGPPIVAEHAIYWWRDGSNFWRAGSAALGTPR
jgi:hypothetical protein